MNTQFPKPLRILCFGDSLTAGFSMWGLKHYPYANHLKAPLQGLFPSTEILIDIAALSGDMVIGHPATARFLPRLKNSCEKAEEKGGSYDWIVMMGGTNDLGWGSEVDAIYEGLKQCWKVALDTGANVLALNILEAAAPSDSLIQRRNQLNALITNHHEDERWYTLDLCSAVPYFSMDTKMRDSIWDDGLHLTEKGYKMMGDAIASRLVEILSDSGPSSLQSDHV